MELALKRLDGVDKVAISIQRQQFVVLYKPGATFVPKDLRAAVAQASVSVVQFHIQARGQVRAEGGKEFFVAGKDRFLLVDSPKMPAGTPLLIGGDVLNDSAAPYQLKVIEFRPVDKP
jgi:NACalpha-BTF3-like transcription factor